MSYRDDGPLGGLVRGKLIRDLALSGKRQTTLANEYGVTSAAISKFKTRHAMAIAAVVADSENEYAGILIADKRFRLNAYQELHEIAMTPQPKVTPAGNVVHRYNTETGQDEEVTEVQLGEARQALKAAAEELGQIPNKVTLSGQLDTTTVYRFQGLADDEGL